MIDLCMVCEKNVDYWRRAAFFEETGETYRRVAAVCLRPLEQFASKLVQDLEWSPDDKAFRISDQLQSSSNPRLNSKCFELLNDFQVWYLFSRGEYACSPYQIVSVWTTYHKDRYQINWENLLGFYSKCENREKHLSIIFSCCCKFQPLKAIIIPSIV